MPATSLATPPTSPSTLRTPRPTPPSASRPRAFIGLQNLETATSSMTSSNTGQFFPGQHTQSPAPHPHLLLHFTDLPLPRATPSLPSLPSSPVEDVPQTPQTPDSPGGIALGDSAGGISRSSSGQSIPFYFAPSSGLGLGLEAPWGVPISASSTSVGHEVPTSARFHDGPPLPPSSLPIVTLSCATDAPARKPSSSSTASSSSRAHASPKRNDSAATTVSSSSTVSTAPTSASEQEEEDESCPSSSQLSLSDPSSSGSTPTPPRPYEEPPSPTSAAWTSAPAAITRLTTHDPRPHSAPDRRPRTTDGGKVPRAFSRRQQALFGRAYSFGTPTPPSTPPSRDASEESARDEATPIIVRPAPRTSHSTTGTRRSKLPPLAALLSPSPSSTSTTSTTRTLTPGQFQLLASPSTSFVPTPATFLTLQLDQESYRGVSTTLYFTPSSTASPLWEFAPRDEQRFPFHHGTFQGAPVLRAVHFGGETDRDFLEEKATVSVGKRNGVWRAEGGSGKEGEGGVRWTFVYEVTDRMSINDKRIPGEKLLRPLLFLCTRNFLDPSRGKKVDVWRVLRKSFLARTTAATCIQPV